MQLTSVCEPVVHSHSEHMLSDVAVLSEAGLSIFCDCTIETCENSLLADDVEWMLTKHIAQMSQSVFVMQEQFAMLGLNQTGQH